MMNNRAGVTKPTEIQVSKRDLTQFVEKISEREESKMYDSVVVDNSSWRNTNRNFDPSNSNWFELRLPGKYPDRRAYHTSFTLGKK